MDMISVGVLREALVGTLFFTAPLLNLFTYTDLIHTMHRDTEKWSIINGYDLTKSWIVIFMSDLLTRIAAANAGRAPELVERKYDEMRKNAFAFFRGTYPLFCEDIHTAVQKAPRAWVCGDLHPQNFGAYWGDDGLMYFDINDFDDAALASCTWDMTRLLTGILLLVTQPYKYTPEQANYLAKSALDAYCEGLAIGQSRAFHEFNAPEPIKSWLIRAHRWTRSELLRRYTNLDKRKRVFKEKGKIFSVGKVGRERAMAILKIQAKVADNPDDPFKLLDVAGRVAGLGSMGVERYILLVEGDAWPEGYAILELKQRLHSALEPYVKQPKWSDPAERVATLEQRLQAVPPARLEAIPYEEAAFTLREFQPIQNRIDIADWNGNKRGLENLLTHMGRLTAWAHLRSSGRQGSAKADDLIAFGQSQDWQADLLKTAQDYRAKIQADFEAFRTADLHT